MKKHSLILAGMLALFVTSCKKDRTCECTYSGDTTSRSSKTTYKKISKANARDLCLSGKYTDSGVNGSQSSSADCKLK